MCVHPNPLSPITAVPIPASHLRIRSFPPRRSAHRSLSLQTRPPARGFSFPSWHSHFCLCALNEVGLANLSALCASPLSLSLRTCFVPETNIPIPALPNFRRTLNSQRASFLLQAIRQ